MNRSQSTIRILCISKFFNVGLFSWKQPILQHFLISLCLIFCSIKKTFLERGGEGSSLWQCVNQEVET